MPKLSVIVCTFNREKYIGETLRRLKDQSADLDMYEVLVIDNNSTDRTPEICKTFLSEHRLENFRYHQEDNQGHTFARNRGIKESKGDYISFLDDDSWVNRDYCRQLIDYFDNHPDVMALGGKITPQYEGQEPKWMSKYLLPLVAGLDMGDDPKEFRHAKYPIGANMAFRSAVFEKYGVFNTHLGRRGYELEGGDEKDMVYRLKKDGNKVCYVPSVHVRHIIPESRLQRSYIKGQAIGVGTSERKRIGHEGAGIKRRKLLEEIFKIGATFILAMFYLLTLKPAKAVMLIRFRAWVLAGYLKPLK